MRPHEAARAPPSPPDAATTASAGPPARRIPAGPAPAGLVVRRAPLCGPSRCCGRGVGEGRAAPVPLLRAAPRQPSLCLYLRILSSMNPARSSNVWRDGAPPPPLPPLSPHSSAPTEGSRTPRPSPPRNARFHLSAAGSACARHRPPRPKCAMGRKGIEREEVTGESPTASQCLLRVSRPLLVSSPSYV